MKITKRAFTLIELLVVIAIIAILAAILFPVFAQAKEAAKKTQCLSNIKNLSLGLILYSSDFDDYIVPGYVGVDPAQPWHGLASWDWLVLPYIKNGKAQLETGSGNNMVGGIFSCPDFKSQTQSNQYGLHQALAPDWSTLPWISSHDPVVSNTTVSSPADTIILAEKGYNGNNINGPALWYPWENNWTAGVGPTGANDNSNLVGTAGHGDCDDTTTSWDSCGAMPRWRHNNQTNFGFTDGHAKSKASKSVLWYKNLYVPGTSMGTPY